MSIGPGEFRNVIYSYYRQHGRTMPWRETRDPYRILVSEIMLQQTQVDRVVGKYEAFLEAFPDFRALAHAPLEAVLRKWQGLGYNRRALALKTTAVRIVEEFEGILPLSPDVLKTLPGIGSATASAICAFAFNIPVVFIETNIRTVFIHFFFSDNHRVSDRAILPLVTRTLDRDNPREWYYALMDYGAMLKKKGETAYRKSAGYRKQPGFQGSRRQARGRILKLLLSEGALTGHAIAAALDLHPESVRELLVGLQKEGFVRESGEGYGINDREM